MSAYSLSVCCIVFMSVFTCQNGLLFLFFCPLFSVGSLSFTLAHNLLIYVTKLHKCDTPCQLYVVFIRLFILQIIKRAFNILKVFSTHMCINFRRPATTMSK